MLTSPKNANENGSLIEGNLFKYKPGITHQYSDRYVMLTKSELQVFKNKWDAKLHPQNNLVSRKIDLSKIKSC